MSNLSSSLYNFRLFDELSKKNSVIHSIHPTAKLLATVFYIVVIVSLPKYAVTTLIPFILYPMLIFLLSDLPLKPLLNRLLLAEFFVVAIGIFNPLFDSNTFTIGTLPISMGVISFLSLIIKCTIIVFSVIIFMASTGIEGIAYSLRYIKTPKLIVLLFLMIYRYIAVFLEEFDNTLNAYKLRNPKAKGIEFSAWGSLLGQSFIRAYDKAQLIYDCMLLRGFDGEYKLAHNKAFVLTDYTYLFATIISTAFFRIFNISQLLGSLFVR